MPSNDDFGWALVGPGNIARRFAAALKGVEGARLAAVVGRDAARAQAFAQEWAPSAWHGSDLATALARPDVQAVYVCTPHPHHAPSVRAALEAGKPVLCEKPLTPSAAATRPLVELARTKNVFLMEAVWTRFLPVYAQVRAWLDAGEIGPVHALQSSFFLDRPYAPGDRRYTAALGGGTLLDIGIYNITVSRMVFPGVAVQGFDVRALIGNDSGNDSGGDNVDVQLAATLDFGHGRTSQFSCGWFGDGDNTLRILGERGHIAVHGGGFWQSTAATLQQPGRDALTVDAPFRINGFEYEIEEAMRCIRAGLAQSPVLPPAESLAVVELMDAMRARIGVRYPFES